MFASSIGWSSFVQAIGWFFLWISSIHSSVVEKHLGFSSVDNTSAMNDEESRAVQVKLKLDGALPFESLNNPASPGVNEDGDTPDSDEEDNIPAINDVESLKKGIIKTLNNKANVPYTILLVGETGVGKSSVLELFANVLAGKGIDHCDFDTLDPTTSTRLYEFKSNNGVIVRVLNTPGLVDPRGIRQNELHKRSIVNHIEKHVGSLTAVLVLVNGTLPRITPGTHYVLSTLTAILPDTLVHNIAFVLTNVSIQLYQNFPGDTVPDILKDAPQFLLDNPIPLQRKYLWLKDVPNMKQWRTEMRKTVKTGEERALEMLVDLFDWLDGLERQPTTETASICAASRNIMATILDPLVRLVERLRKFKEKVQ